VWIELRFGWQAPFLMLGASGFVWLALWLRFYEAPERHPRLTAEEYALIREVQPAGGRSIGFAEVARQRPAWAIVVSRFFADPVWWLYITWLPLYLHQTHGFDLKQIGMFAWLPFVAADAGSLGGGWMSGFLIARGWSVNGARKTVILAGMLCMSLGFLAAGTNSAAGALAWIAVVLFGFQAWINNVQTLPSDYFPEQAVGAVTGMGGMGAGIGAMLLIQATGFVVDRWHTYTPILIVAASLPLVATAALFILGGPVRRLKW
jgi:ACS family hexuronate transporter-like MFS transporter